MRAWRWPVRLLLPALVVGGLVLDSRLDRSEDEVVEARAVASELAVPDTDALSSTWLCPVVHASRVGELGVEAAATVVVSNASNQASRARVELLSATSASRVLEIDLPALTSRRVAIEVPDTDDLVAALVESPSGGIAVTREFSSPHGVDVAPCAARPATQWFIPSGDTQRDAVDEIVVFNPLPSDAVIDLSFATEAETGAFVAVDLEGLVVPPQTSVRIDLGDHVRRRDHVATTVDARAGRVVVDHLQTYDGSSGRRGFSAQLGSTQLGERWLMPLGRVDAGRHLEISVMNPSDEVAEVDLAAVSAGVGGDPVAITVGPREVVVVPVVAFQEEAPTVPTVEVVGDLPFGIVVESANGVPVNVGVEALRGLATSPIDEVEAEATDDDAPAEEQPAEEADEATPVPLGISHLVAGPTPQPRWLLPMSAPEGSVVRVAVQNPGTEPRTVEISSLDGTSVGTLTLGSAAVEVVDVPAGIIVVDADGPIIAMGEWFGPEGGLGSTSGLVR